MRDHNACFDGKMKLSGNLFLSGALYLVVLTNFPEVLIKSHNICFNGKIKKINPVIPSYLEHCVK